MMNKTFGRPLCLSVACAALLASCANPPPISTSVGQNIQNAASAAVPGLAGNGGTIAQGILNAQYNLNQAQSLGILAATDPAPGCINSVVTTMGLGGGTAAPSFAPKVTDLISAGSVGYIYLAQLKAQGVSLTLSPSCTQLLGQIVLDAAKAGAQGAAGMIPGLTGLPAL